MRKRLASSLVIFSFLGSLALCGLLVRSWFVWDAVSRSNWTAEPMTAAAVAWGQKANPGADLNFVSRGEGYGITVWRGRVTLGHGLQKDVTSRWDEAFEARYVDRPNWSYATIRNDDDDYTPPGGEPQGFWGRVGFGDAVQTQPSKFVSEYRNTTVPLWPAVIATAVPPIAWTRRRLRARRRARRGLCVACGYDLRGASAARCSECGTIPVIGS